jgi:RNA polymerase sigma-70 factor (ECF subfamily)
MTTPSVTDEELIQRILAGDPLAERALYDRYIHRVFQIALRISGDSDVAADYAQETFIRAFRSIAQYRAASSFGTWLRAVVLSVALTGEKKRNRSAGSSALDLMADGSSARPSLAFDFVARIGTELNKMSEKLRTVFLLYDVEGYSHQEIAAALQIPLGTSRARLAEARAKLRAALPDYGAGAAS